MGLKSWSAEAPANIALIKYMGKTEGNRPTNSSLSYTLDHLITRVEIESIEGMNDSWTPLSRDGFLAPMLSQKAQDRFLRHFSFLKEQWGVEGSFALRSANNFPS